MNPNQAFCFAIVILLQLIIDMQQQQVFAFFILYQRWVNEYMQMLNVAFLRRQRHLRRIRVAPYTWIIPRPAESWFDFVPLDEINHLLFTFIASALGSKLAINSRTTSSHVFRASCSLLAHDVLPIGLLEPFALLAAICHIVFCLFLPNLQVTRICRAIALTYHTCKTIGPIKQNSARSRLIRDRSSQCRVEMTKILAWEWSWRIMKRKTSIHAESWRVNIKIPADWVV